MVKPETAGGRLAGTDKVRVKVVERFPSARLRNRVGMGRRARSALGLVVAALVLGLVLAAVLSTVVWAIAGAIHHATTA